MVTLTVADDGTWTLSPDVGELIAPAHREDVERAASIIAAAATVAAQEG